MLSAGILAAFCLLPMIMGSVPTCDDDELAYPDEGNIKNLVFKKISEKIQGQPSYDCELQSKAQIKFDLIGEDGDDAKSFKVVDT
ncbi:hypothetical protein Y032_0012g1803 [Ancylostoma ceylanicum]|nr:hypothetical protein Y032_0012g1803 [Ancylostoma ceylanicum]